MTKNLYTVVSNERVARDTHRMVLCGDTAPISRPGQFLNIAVEGFYLRRPISVADWDQETVTVFVKIVGDGTQKMAGMTPGERLDILAGLGNGYDPDAAAGRRVMLIGGGYGVPPLIGLARCLRERGISFSAALGFQTADAVFGADEIARQGADVRLATADGSAGVKGLVTGIAASADYDYYFACGPEGMLRAVHALGKEGQLSFEERMGCGFGACMGCSRRTVTGYKRICTDGPVLLSSEVLFHD